MGKALLILVLGSGIVLAKQLYNSHEGGLRTAKDQRAYEEHVLAREIAISAFNVGMGEIRSHGDNLRDATIAFNGTNNAGRSGVIGSGRHAGGRYTVRADMPTGHSIRLTAHGYYGRYLDSRGREMWRGKAAMHDEYRIYVLVARDRSLINVNFIPGAAGYCSAVFYQAFRPEMPAGTIPPAVMLFTPANGDRSGHHPAREIVVEAGTQMNFFIGIDQNCSERPTHTTSCQALTYAHNYSLNYSHYRADGTNAGSGRFDYLHYALDVETGELDQAQESIWGRVEQHRTAPNRWRIGWEDIHNTSWNNTSATATPSNSLQATKRLGYSGLGWPTTDARGYSAVQDFGSRPDFEDQMIEVSMTPVDSDAARTRIATAIATYQNCNLTVPTDLTNAYPPPPTTEPPPPTTTEPPPPTTTTPTTPPPTTTRPPSETDGATCNCQGNKKVYVFHRPPGNENNPQRICVGEPAWLNAHSQQHNDYVICRGLDRR